MFEQRLAIHSDGYLTCCLHVLLELSPAAAKTEHGRTAPFVAPADAGPFVLHSDATALGIASV
jgi:hypothetical protein